MLDLWPKLFALHCNIAFWVFQHKHMDTLLYNTLFCHNDKHTHTYITSWILFFQKKNTSWIFHTTTLQCTRMSLSIHFRCLLRANLRLLVAVCCRYLCGAEGSKKKIWEAHHVFQWYRGNKRILQGLVGKWLRTMLLVTGIEKKIQITFSINGSWKQWQQKPVTTIKNATIADHVISLLLSQASHLPFLHLDKNGRLGCSVCFVLFQGTHQYLHRWT